MKENSGNVTYLKFIAEVPFESTDGRKKAINSIMTIKAPNATIRYLNFNGKLL